MSNFQSNLVSLLLKQYFGEIVQKVGLILLERECTNFKTLQIKSNLPIKELKDSLIVLVTHNLVNFKENENGIFEYTLVDDNVLRILNYSKYVYYSRKLYGMVGELLVEVLMDNGTISTSCLFKEVKDILIRGGATNSSFNDIKEVFVSLVNQRFIQRHDKDTDCLLKENPEKLFSLYDVQLKFDGKSVFLSDELGNKRKQEEEMEEVYWRLNLERYDQFIRDQVLVNSAKLKLDDKAAQVMDVLLRIASTNTSPFVPTSAPINYKTVIDMLSKDANFNMEVLDDYLYLLGDDTINFITPATEKGSYVISFKLCFRKLFEELASTFVECKYNHSCHRIFKLLLYHNNLDQKQIEEKAMLPGKEANECIFSLHNDKLILTPYTLMRTQDISKNQIIFSVDRKLVAKKLLGYSFKSICNCLTLHDKILKDNEILLQKKMKADALIEAYQSQGLGSEHLQEIYDMISPFEKQEIEKVEKTLDMLLGCANQLGDATIILKNFLFQESL